MTGSDLGVVIVTGAAGGIGSAIVRAVLDGGGSVVGVDLDACPFPADDRIVWVRGDVTDGATIDSAFGAARDAGGARALLSSAFADHRAPLEELTAAQIMAVFEQQAIGAWRWATRLVDERAGAPGDTAVVHVSSVHARSAAAGAAPYAMAKSALGALTRAMAVEWGPRGVRCNAVEPGFVPVPRNAHRWGDADAMARRLPLRRVVRPVEVAEVVVFLASPRAAGVTGVCLPVDAGMGAALPEWA
ncbi:MAG: SDR family oxidoreductase [Actinocatenispora sp.]